jgi:hypothetical protein
MINQVSSVFQEKIVDIRIKQPASYNERFPGVIVSMHVMTQSNSQRTFSSNLDCE